MTTLWISKVQYKKFNDVFVGLGGLGSPVHSSAADNVCDGGPATHGRLERRLGCHGSIRPRGHHQQEVRSAAWGRDRWEFSSVQAFVKVKTWLSLREVIVNDRFYHLSCTQATSTARTVTCSCAATGWLQRKGKKKRHHLPRRIISVSSTSGKDATHPTWAGSPSLSRE